MSFSLKTVTFIIIYQVTILESAKILGVIPTPSYSHQIVYQPLWKELSLRGHQVILLTTDVINDPKLTNLTEIDLHFSYKVWNEKMAEVIENQDNPVNMTDIMVNALNTAFDQQLSHPQVQALIKNDKETFDLLMVEFLMPTMIAFAERFKCPFIGLTSLDAPTLYHGIIGNPAHPVLNPDFNLPFVGRLTFKERLQSVLYTLILKIVEKTGLYINDMDKIAKKHFGNHIPHLSEIQKNISMLFVNTDPIFHPIRPFVPAVIQIGGGTHRQVPKPLPKKLQEQLDSSTEGFIYFSLGSNVKSKDLSENKRNMILETFSELSYKVLWKFELADLPGKPDNVIISEWFPQQDVFKHPNIKLFITQGGLQSIDEAVYDNIPMVGIPFFADQPNNIKRMVHNGLGLSLDYKTMDKKAFKETILEVINNPKYRNRVRKLAELARDQPMTGLEKAVWWTEYVIRHKGAKHLRSPALDLPSYQYYLLDVIGFCVLAISIAFFILLKLVQMIYRLIKYCVTGEKKLKTL